MDSGIRKPITVDSEMAEVHQSELPLCKTCHGCGYDLEVCTDLAESVEYAQCWVVGCDRYPSGPCRQCRDRDDESPIPKSPFFGPCKSPYPARHNLVAGRQELIRGKSAADYCMDDASDEGVE